MTIDDLECLVEKTCNDGDDNEDDDDVELMLMYCLAHGLHSLLQCLG